MTHHPLSEPNELEGGLQHLEGGFTEAGGGGVVEVAQGLGGKAGISKDTTSASGKVRQGSCRPRAVHSERAMPSNKGLLLSRLAVP